MAGQSRGLGRGLDALLGGTETDRNDPEVRMLPIRAVKPNPKQPRTAFRDEGLEELAESIRSQGVLQPILVRPKSGPEGQRYEIVAGERRWRASQLANLTEIPALVRKLSEDESLAIALIENLQREDLNPMEEARGIHELQERLGVSQEDLARRLGKSRSGIANTLRLLQLSEAAQADVSEGRISAGHGRALMSITEEGAQDRLRARIVKNKLSVRQAEAEAGHWKKNGFLPGEDAVPRETVKREPARLPEKLGSIQERLSDRFGLNVKVSGSEDKGRIAISYATREELERLLAALEAAKPAA